MHETYDTTFYYEGGTLKAKTKLYQNGKPPRSILLSADAASDLIESMRKEKSKVKSVRFEGDDLVAKFEGFRVTLHNRKRFKVDDRFNFLFELVKKKKIDRNGLGKKLMAIGLSAAILIGAGVTVKNLIKKQKNTGDDTTTSYSDEAHDKYIKTNKDEITTSELAGYTNKEDVSTLKNDTIETKKAVKTETSSNNGSSSNNNGNNSSKAEDDIIDSNIDHGSLSDSEKAEKTRNLYGDIIEKYCNMYGLDSNVICAIATQERGVHSDSVDEGGAIGLMQIQVSVWTHETINAYNYETEKTDEIYISLDDLREVDFNIKVGCAIFQNYLKLMDGNYLAAIQCYNMGDGAMRSILNEYSYSTGRSVDEILKDTGDLGWMEYRSGGYAGDPNYIENVMRYYEGNSLSNAKTR